MVTLMIDDKTIEAKKMLELLLTRPYAKVVKEPNAETLKAMEEARTGKTKEMKNIPEYFNQLRKRANV
jgi:hypothetical protein